MKVYCPGVEALMARKIRIVELYEPAKLGEVGADEGEVMPIVQLSDLSNPFQARPSQAGSPVQNRSRLGRRIAAAAIRPLGQSFAAEGCPGGRRSIGP